MMWNWENKRCELRVLVENISILWKHYSISIRMILFHLNDTVSYDSINVKNNLIVIFETYILIYMKQCKYQWIITERNWKQNKWINNSDICSDKNGIYRIDLSEYKWIKVNTMDQSEWLDYVLHTLSLLFMTFIWHSRLSQTLGV